MEAIILLASVPLLMWVGQTILLRIAGLPVRWRIDSSEAPRFVRTGGRLITQVSLIAVLMIYPLLRGETPVSYYGRMLPLDASVAEFAQGLAASILFLAVLYGVWLACGGLSIEVHQSRKRWIRRLVLLPATAVLGAAVEELLFRGVILSDLLSTRVLSPAAAVLLGTLIFAVAHYVRKVKRYWTIGGHLMLGLLLCVAFVETGRLWLPIGLHAGGIVAIMGTRPFIRYRGPAWLMGASVFPYAGVVGIVGLGILTAFVAMHYGTS